MVSKHVGFIRGTLTQLILENVLELISQLNITIKKIIQKFQLNLLIKIV